MPLTTRAAAAGALFLMLAGPGATGIIDSRSASPSYGWDSQSQFAANPASVGGGSFTADGTRLDSFTLNIQFGAGFFRAVVMAIGFDSSVGMNAPIGSVLWQSDDLPADLVSGDLFFAPNLTLTVGLEYFIGVDTGLVTNTAGGRLSLSAVGGTAIDGGRFYANYGGSGYSALPDMDIASRIEMSSPTVQTPSQPVPEPSALALVGAALAGLMLTAGGGRGRTPADAG